MNIECISKQCANVFDQREHVILGISPFNSYFSEERITWLAKWAFSEFKRVSIYVPDGPTHHTLQAFGYQENKAKKKARRQNKYLQNKIIRALSKVGLTDEQSHAVILNSEKLDGNTHYQKVLDEVTTQYETDLEFRQKCLDCSNWVLSSNQPAGWTVDEQSLLQAVNYLLAELPIFFQSGSIVESQSVVFVYHQCPDLLRDLFQSRSYEWIGQRQGFTTVMPADNSPY